MSENFEFVKKDKNTPEAPQPPDSKPEEKKKIPGEQNKDPNPNPPNNPNEKK